MLGIAAGLLIVRGLPLEQFAIYTIALAVQTTMVILGDSGVTQSLLARGGAVAGDRRRFTEVVNAATALRRRLETCTLLVGLPILVALLRSYSVGWTYALGACAGVALALRGTILQTLYGTVLYLQLRPIDAQKAALAAGLVRVVCTVAALALSRVWLPFLLIGAAGVYLHGELTRRRATAHLDDVASVSADDQVAMVVAFRNQLLSGIYFALQPQITVWILTLFGTATRVAEAGALGRLAVAFSLVSSAFTGLALPRFARYQDPARVRRGYVALVLLMAMIGGGTLVLAWLFPRPLLMVLGSSYAHLQRELVWMVGASALSLVAAAIYLLNTARGWVRGIWMGVPATIAVQVVLVMSVDVSTVRGAILIQASAFAAPLLINLAIALRGMRADREPVPMVSS